MTPSLSPQTGHASGYSVFYNAQNLTWDWNAFCNGNSRNGSSLAKIDAEWAARDAWDYLSRETGRKQTL